ncbi:energy transducer TonB [uncultured Alistipes sp.]|uniref:energy transducer TonB n=1 Tax=uncultured Alistipes sp. TaxID=538949 RepID=UPI002582FCD4|nr:energy transducer TonB [uncultured Alistipes sp.]
MKRLITWTVCLVLLHAAAFADGPAKVDGQSVPEMPKFGGGGPVTFKRWVLRNLDLSGSLFSEGDEIRGEVSFVVAKNGKLRELDVSKLGVSALGRRIEKAIAASPAWAPAMQDGKPQAQAVKVLFDLRLVRDASGALCARDIAAYRQADKSPAFRGGGPREFQAWMVHLADSLTGTSVEELQYRVSLRFVVECDGTMSDIDLQARRGKGYSTKKVRQRHYAVPVWTPAVIDGEPVRFRTSISLDFSPENEQTEAADSSGLPVPCLISEKMPEFKGGDLNTFRSWVMWNVKYPSELYREGVGGRVVVTFVIERDGALSSVKVIRSPHPQLTDAVVQVLEKSPRWEPGTEDGIAVRVKYTLPVDFRIPPGTQASGAGNFGRSPGASRSY